MRMDFDRMTQLWAVAQILSHLESADRDGYAGMGFSEMASGVPDDVPVVAIAFLHILRE